MGVRELYQQLKDLFSDTRDVDRVDAHIPIAESSSMCEQIGKAWPLCKDQLISKDFVPHWLAWSHRAGFIEHKAHITAVIDAVVSRRYHDLPRRRGFRKFIEAQIRKADVNFVMNIYMLQLFSYHRCQCDIYIKRVCFFIPSEQ